MEEIELTEKNVNHAIFQFLFPFSILEGKEDDTANKLKENGYEWFRLDKLEKEDDYYGQYEINHEDLENYYLPFTNRILFPKEENGKGFQRYTKALGLKSHFKAPSYTADFVIHSVDVFVCPYQIGILNVRVDLLNKNELTYSQILDFGAKFRVMEEKNSFTSVICEGQSFDHVQDYIFECVIPDIKEYMSYKSEKSAYFESFPFFEDNRLYVQALISLEGDITEEDVYRLGNLDGFFQDKPYISAHNKEFIHSFIEEKAYMRWAPYTYILPESSGFFTLTKQTGREFSRIANSFYGQFYYGLILTLFHKIVLLKLENNYSEIRIEQDTKKVEKLIHAINAFSSNYFFFELATHSEGRDIFVKLRERFRVELLYEDTRNTLESLYQYQDNFTSKQSSSLLQILTLYSVITGIFGMNLMVDSLNKDVNWTKTIGTLSFYEYIALFVIVSGVGISVFLSLRYIAIWYLDKQERKKWRKQIEYPNTK
ncbi:hypothetical protein AC622_02915 [Bacillus sp. FJAT-27916]|uniref:hypothetical protein n=1 Tax=Bacillus sp. FJAT-27916 TaxID=1679169 RepID=UPI0006712991|nr:hypothetical protein [Bacillus sp. FJAT-27916]KMY43335.1 hypothetical protein AC622_02915 [Bacillus sp. FJAT-27916]